MIFKASRTIVKFELSIRNLQSALKPGRRHASAGRSRKFPLCEGHTNRDAEKETGRGEKVARKPCG